MQEGNVLQYLSHAAKYLLLSTKFHLIHNFVFSVQIIMTFFSQTVHRNLNTKLGF